MSNVTMPRLSDTMEEGTISRWLKKAGDAVQKGDILAEIETDKANMDLEAYDAGVLEEILVQEGETVPIGKAIAVISSGNSAGQKKEGGQDAATPAAKQPQEVPAQSQEQSEQEAPVQSQEEPAAANAGKEMPNVAPTAKSEPSADGSENDRNETATVESSGENERLRVSPLARRMAEEHGIDLRKLQGKGKHGRIERDDIEDFLEQQQTATTASSASAQSVANQPSANESEATSQEAAVASTQAAVTDDVEVSKLTRMQSIVARRLTESKQTIPHFYVSNEVDMTDVLAMRQSLNASVGEGGVKVSVNDLVIKACALALEKFPEVNSSIKGDQFLRHKHIHVGMAVDIPAGLVVPVIHDANIKGVRTIAREAKALIEKARASKLAPADLEGGTFSVSNLGMMDVTDFVAVINPPQAAILAVASTRKQFVPIDGQPVIRDLMPMTMSADHRILYGATVARFLQEVKRLLQNPYDLLG